LGINKFMQNIRLKVIGCACAMVALASFAHAWIRVQEPTVSQLSTVWVGWATPIHYFRLQLVGDGGGLCCSYDKFTRKAYLYSVVNWTLHHYDLALTLKPIDAEAGPLTMKGMATAGSLELELGDGHKNGWRAKTHFYEERSIEFVMGVTKKRMQDFTQPEEKK
jgi:hypothetical protein